MIETAFILSKAGNIFPGPSPYGCLRRDGNPNEESLSGVGGSGGVYDSDEIIIPRRTVRFAVTKGHRS